LGTEKMTRRIDPKLTWEQFYQKQAWNDEITLAVSEGSAEIAGLSREAMAAAAKDNEKLRELVASENAATREAIADHAYVMAEGFKLLDRTTSEGFQLLHADLRDQGEQLREISSTLGTGFALIETRLGDLGASLEELIEIAQTPEQTWAYEQFHTAIQAQRRGLYPEAFESVTRAIDGFGTHPGYKLEHRFHRLLGHIRWAASDDSVRDFAKAEKSYLDATRLAETVNKSEASHCLLRAAELAYHRKDFGEAEKRSMRALKFHDGGEQRFLLAKHMLASGGDPTGAFKHLKAAIHFSPSHFHVAVDRYRGEHEFTQYENRINDIARQVIGEQQAQIAQAIAAVNEARNAIKTIQEIGKTHDVDTKSKSGISVLAKDNELLAALTSLANAEVDRGNLDSLFQARFVLGSISRVLLPMAEKYGSVNESSEYLLKINKNGKDDRSRFHDRAIQDYKNEAEAEISAGSASIAEEYKESRRLLGGGIIVLGVFGFIASLNVNSFGLIIVSLMLILYGIYFRETSDDKYRSKIYKNAYDSIEKREMPEFTKKFADLESIRDSEINNYKSMESTIEKMRDTIKLSSDILRGSKIGPYKIGDFTRKTRGDAPRV
jgi:hypothetical protein